MFTPDKGSAQESNLDPIPPYKKKIVHEWSLAWSSAVAVYIQVPVSGMSTIFPQHYGNFRNEMTLHGVYLASSGLVSIQCPLKNEKIPQNAPYLT